MGPKVRVALNVSGVPVLVWSNIVSALADEIDAAKRTVTKPSQRIAREFITPPSPQKIRGRTVLSGQADVNANNSRGNPPRRSAALEPKPKPRGLQLRRIGAQPFDNLGHKQIGGSHEKQ